MKIIIITALCALCYPLTLHAAGAITYSGIPCRWTCAHEVNDSVGPKKDDPVAAQKDRRIMRQVSRASFPTGPSAVYIERGDGRLLLLDPQSYRSR